MQVSLVIVGVIVVDFKSHNGAFIFPYGFLNSNNIRNWVGVWFRKKSLFELGKKSVHPKINVRVQKLHKINSLAYIRKGCTQPFLYIYM